MGFKSLLEGLLAVAEKHGILAGLVTLFCLFLCWFLWTMFREVINSKNSEIERLVNERNELQKLILKDRFSSNNKNEGD